MLRLQLVLNHGAAFGLGAGLERFLAVLSFAGVVLFGLWARHASGRIERCGAALAAGGAAGNLLDRLIRPPGVLHGARSYLLQDEDGQVSLTHSVSAGLDYALIGPEHAWLHDRNRAEYVAASDAEALDAARLLCRIEGLIPALESAHAVAEVVRRAPAGRGEIYIVNMSGRGDKDIDIYRENLKELDGADTSVRGQP